MPEWDVSPSGVRGVLAITQGVGAEFDAHLDALQGDLKGGATQSASEPITAALTGWLDVQRPDLEFLPARTMACINGAAQATNAYVEGDLEMAANAQAAAAAAPDPRGLMPGGGGRVPR